MTRKAIIWRLIALVVLLVGATMIWFAAGHGKVVTTGGEGAFTLQRVSDLQAVQDTLVKNGSTTVSSGKYILRYKSGQSESLKYIEVPTFLRSVKATFSNNIGQRQVDRVAINTLPTITQGPNNTITGVNTTQQIGSTFTHLYDDPIGNRTTVGQIPISSDSNMIHNNIFIGFTQTTDTGDQQLQRYNFLTQKTDTLPKVYKYNQTVTLIKPTTAQSDLFGIAYSTNKKLFIDVYNGSTLAHQLDTLKNVAFGEEGSRAISVSDKFIAAGNGSNFAQEADTTSLTEAKGQPKTKNYTINIYDIADGKQIKSIGIGKTNSVASLQINNDGTYVSAIDGDKLRIFNVSTGKEVFTYSSSSLINPQWVSGAQLIFGTVEGGLFKLDAEDRSATSLFAPTNLNLSSFDVFDNKVYFTAFSTAQYASQGTPDGYVLYLDKESTNSNQLALSTPNQNSQVAIQSLNNVIYAVPNTNDTAGLDPYFTPIDPADIFRQQVDAFLNQKFSNYKQYKIVYGQHF